MAQPASTSNKSTDVILANDKLSIRVFREPELTAEWNNGNSVGYAVDAAGNLTFPLVGTIYVQGLTLEQFRVKLTGLLDQYLVNPEVNLSFYDKKIKQQVTIMGQVVKSGNYEYSNGMSIVRLVAEAGGFLKTSDLADDRVRRRLVVADSAHVRIARLKSDATTDYQVVDVQAIMDGKAPDVQLEPSDLVIVPTLSDSGVGADEAAGTASVLGQVNQPGIYEIATTGTLVRLISEARGMTRYAAPDRVVLTRKTSTEEFTKRVNMSAIINGIASDIPLQPGDVVFVPESDF